MSCKVPDYYKDHCRMSDCVLEDGKEMKLDSEKLGIKGVMEEVDRHSRILARQEELTGN